MRVSIISAVAGLGILMAASLAAAQDISGLWKTEPGDTGGHLHVKILPCGDDICGTIDKAIDKEGVTVEDYEHQGKAIVWDMKTNGEGYWNKGKIWSPDRDKTYKSKMALTDGKLKVSGCVFGGLICRGQMWEKIE